MEGSFTLTGRVADVIGGTYFHGSVSVHHGLITKIARDAPITTPNLTSGPWILPGLVDAHVHIESSMLPPAEFARLAVPHGTVATVSDPHEIANVLGSAGCHYMVQSGQKTPLLIAWGVPSCVPATTYETAGAALSSTAVEELLGDPAFRYLSEMMNYPGVLAGESEVMAKIAAARAIGKPIDGHAPALRGDALARYIAAGISTDHESFTYEEGHEKLSRGMMIIIREGSAAKNFDALCPLLAEFPGRIMLCSDDKHPHDLVKGHINSLVARAFAAGIDPMTVLRAASLVPARHYGISLGMIQEGDPADFIIVDSLCSMNVRSTFIKGRRIAHEGKSLLPSLSGPTPNHFIPCAIRAPELRVPASSSSSNSSLRVIEAQDGQLITRAHVCAPFLRGGVVESDPASDVLKLVVINRYRRAPPAVAFIQGFGLREGAIASSVAHDSHNIIAVGCSDNALVDAIAQVVEAGGGVSISSSTHRDCLALPIAGLMSDKDGYVVAAHYDRLDSAAQSLGSPLRSPFMTLSFMALLVIPELKLSDRL